MEAGYDYLLINRRSRAMRRMLPLAGAGVIVLALIGVLVWGLLAFVFDGSSEEPEVVDAVEATPVPQPLAATPTPTPTPTVAAVAPPQPVAPPPPPTPVPELPSDLARVVGLYPGASIKAVDWADLLGARGPIDLIDDEPWEPATPVAVGQLPVATRLIIPTIDVDSGVQQLTIANNVIEPPQNAVGHIPTNPTTANPGEAGSVWLIGHLESPILGEGNVFGQLPELPSRLRGLDRGEVFAIVENGTESYRYRLVDSQVIPQEEFTHEYLSLRDDGSPQLFMVTAVPRGIYDQRLIVRGVLEGVRS